MGILLSWHARKEEDDEVRRSALARRAREFYVKSWKLDDSIPETYARYGATFLLEGQDASKGVKTLEHAYALLPNAIPILIWLARAKLEVGEPNEARRLALLAYSAPRYGWILDAGEFEKLEKVLEVTGGLPRDSEEDAEVAPGEQAATGAAF
jgi:hypothetical protein